MDSTALPQGFSEWADFDNQTLKTAPTTKGAYVIRLKGGVHFGRLRGTSDIAYIGRSDKSLRERLWQYLRPGRTQFTNLRVNQLMKQYDFEVAWLEDPTPNIHEHNLQLQYVKDHDELPPLNHAYVRTVKIELVGKLGFKGDLATDVERL